MQPGDPSPTQPQEVRAWAKLTLSLRVVGVRADGMHLIDAEMVSLDLADTLIFSAGDGLTVEGATTGPVVSPGEDNLVRRALARVGRRASVHLVKRIPAGGGLGGGSADAAAVLRWAGVDDPAVAVSLGADVTFCLAGGRARVTGVGEEVHPLPHRDATYTLGLAPFGCSTAAVYAAWDDMGGPAGPGPNDLETAAVRVEPRLARWRDRLGQASGETPVLAGSGSTWFVPGSHPGPDHLVVRTASSVLAQNEPSRRTV